MHVYLHMLNTSEIVSLTDYLAVLVQGTTLLLPSDLWNVERRQVWTLWGDPKSNPLKSNGLVKLNKNIQVVLMLKST